MMTLDQIRSSYSIRDLEATLIELQTMVKNVQPWAQPAFQNLIERVEYRIERVTDWATD
jgi:hypothetical protein